ncbi:sodium channel protein Nach [Cephus cinctus]|uniref:Sodium channel protein Nach n=1 Tax=Cephus cinctus TaxID=211228 RepID=A0AAJ7FJE7_CEPCN|nr:sodium channel protein Nach [Cephus cinctus]
MKTVKNLKNVKPIKINAAKCAHDKKEVGSINKMCLSPKLKNFRNTLVDFLKNTGMIGCANYVAPGRHPVERYIWALIHVIAIMSTIYVIIDTTVDFADTSPVTSVESYNYPVQDVEFPGISVCAINKISYAAAWDFATELEQIPSTRAMNLTRNDIMKMLPVLGRLYQFDIEPQEEKISRKLHHLLQAAYKIYDVNLIMSKLAPKCRNIMTHCFWSGKEQFYEDIIFLRKTQDGYCCTFNYVRVTDYFGKTKNQHQFDSSAVHPQVIGSSFGLTILLNPELDDYYYQTSFMKGFKILVSKPKDYPDRPSGSLTEIIISPRTEVWLNLEATTLYAVKSIRNYKPQKRKCLFENEEVSEFGGYYSYSDCFIYCRVKEMAELCECIAFFYPIPISLASTKICNLENLECLQKHRKKWWNVVPLRMSYNISKIFNETENGLNENYLKCDCLPSCEDLTYHVKSTQAPLHSSSIRMGRNINISIKDHMILHIFFNKPGLTRLRQDVLVYWYELMSNYGGICGFFLGVSLISVIEFLYFFSVRLFDSKWKNAKKQEIITNQQYFHWNEIHMSHSGNKW